MHYLKDYCAIILSNVFLYEGLVNHQGTIALYGKSNLVHSLYKYETFESRDNLVSMLQIHSPFPIKISPFFKDPIDVTVCVPDIVGIKGLEEYLESRSFSWSRYQNEKEAAGIFLDEIKERPSEMKIDKEISMDYSSLNGRVIAAAITMGNLRLSGSYGCASSKASPAPFLLRMESPLDLGQIMFKTKFMFPNFKTGLAFINGNLRILSSTNKLIDPMNKPTWEIHPKFDATENHGLMTLKVFNSFLKYMSYDYQSPAVDINEPVDLLLGCY